MSSQQMQAYKNYVVFVCWHCDFRIYLGWRQPRELRRTAGHFFFALYIFTCQVLFERLELKADTLLHQQNASWLQTGSNHRNMHFCGKHICLHKKLGVGQRENWKEKVEVPRWLDICVYIHSADPPDFDFLNRKLVVATPTSKMRLYKVLKWYEVIG